MELQLGLALPNHSSKTLNHDSSHNNKRSFSNFFHHADTHNNTSQVMLPTLSLLSLTPSHSCNLHDNRLRNDENDAVGWPPVNSYRKKLRYDNYVDEVAENDQMVWIHHHHHSRSSVAMRRSNMLYVKVKMEGNGIARKINLNMHHSYQTLKETLMDMFGKCHQHSKCYELAYQDQEGDWLLADDVPWKSFTQCAQRLKLVKNSRYRIMPACIASS
ncbi:PREDICTED: auxin-responsive protein IAA9-like isoform X2 [Lupinus angustifolius]|uniref:auxin-responsive protein IAA9-like isoform X2 n=1 Tax=Lupinus angustifolius TaxID=3871 RepID=UPI00092E3A69|nr:PREDICTED: auxin-responsive protein IAA9-like isoform X2 [Lupinus angustifolius]